MAQCIRRSYTHCGGIHGSFPGPNTRVYGPYSRFHTKQPSVLLAHLSLTFRLAVGTLPGCRPWGPGLYQLGSAPKHGHTLRAAPEGHPVQGHGSVWEAPWGGPEALKARRATLVTSVPSVVPTSTDRAPSLTRRDKIPFTRSASTTRPNRVSTHMPQGDLPISTPSQPQPRIAHAHHRKLWPRRMPVLLTFR